MLDAFGLEVLDRDECVALLASVEVGRVVFTKRGLPAVQPVKYLVQQDSVWFPVQARTDLFGSADDGVVAFEVDAFDPGLRTGWWVTVLGRASAAVECDLPQRRPELSWQPPLATDVRCIRIPIEVVSGRRVA
ncbi:pyridoxamine 5'-phosphate oxidase family protein [Amycolatopsis sp. K13G38]|uniref:Pyridoxamine 5'-phosphate oxidase family protein n=2 Tax=Amycolatopsis acididurans TaxID=2724524 RepID=A0ABX1IXQ3_9PSEU|nr:pyridoxamine 5'-phosphate oxidase family protein [Amycolatopsis acididurans]